MSHSPNSSFLDRSLGCLVGGALGDALGYPVEFLDSLQILDLVGPRPPESLAYRGPALVSDDTQMTLFSAEGLLRAQSAGVSHGTPEWLTYLLGAYQRWYSTQALRPETPRPNAGPLLSDARLYARRAPGNTCLAALGQSFSRRQPHTPSDPANGSKGCGAIMRSAPFGIAARSREQAFQEARDAGALTHGHPSGFLPAAYFAALIFDVVREKPLAQAMAAADPLLAAEPECEETVAAIAQARAAVQWGAPTVPRIEALGGGWVGEEALAIALYCCLTHDPASGPTGIQRSLWHAAAHAGDSDSTASLVGNLLGARMGYGALPKSWIDDLEALDLLRAVGGDLGQAAQGGPIDGLRFPPDPGCMMGLRVASY